MTDEEETRRTHREALAAFDEEMGIWPDGKPESPVYGITLGNVFGDVVEIRGYTQMYGYSESLKVIWKDGQ